MRLFDFYEFAGLLVPGTTVLVLGGAVLWAAPLTEVAENVGIGEVGVGAVPAYGAGHIVQAIGNLLEMAWWRLLGGWPSDWVATGTTRLLHEKQLEALPTVINRQLGLSNVKLDG